MDAKTDPSRQGALAGENLAVVSALQASADRARRTGLVCLGASLSVGVAIFGVFLLASQEASKQRAAQQEALVRVTIEQESQARSAFLQQILVSLVGTKGEQEARQKIEEPNSTKKDVETKEAFKDTLTVLLQDLGTLKDAASKIVPPPIKRDIPSDTFSDVLYNITSSILRIGSVLVGIFMIQILVSFSRYYFKLSEHLSMSSALIRLAGGKLSDLKTTAPLLLPSSIDFGKAPTSPVEKVLEGAFGMVKELTKKIPGK
jgi:hypothetical protein